MTVQEVKKLLRERIRQELGSVPEVLFERLWQVRERNLRELAEEDVCEADVLEGDVGTDYVDAMRLMLEGWQEATEARFPFSPRGRKPTPHAPKARLWEEYPEIWWRSLPERDRQEVVSAWEFAYNVLEADAVRFRQQHAVGGAFTHEEAIAWLTARENGCTEWLGRDVEKVIPSYILSPEDVQLWRNDFTVALGRQWRYLRWEDDSVPIAQLVQFCRHYAFRFGMHPHFVLQCLLCGERTPARVLALLFPYGLGDVPLLPLIPPYLSAEAVERIWQTLRFRGSAKSCVLSHLSLREVRSYVQAWSMWNEVAPAQWRIRSYRHFRTEWLRLFGEDSSETPRRDANGEESLLEHLFWKW